LAAFFEVIFAVIKAVPAIKSLWDQAVAYYIQVSIEKMREEDVKAIKEAIEKKDQRKLEEQLFSKKGGELSGIAGTSIHDPGSLPNVMPPDKGRN